MYLLNWQNEELSRIVHLHARYSLDSMTDSFQEACAMESRLHAGVKFWTSLYTVWTRSTQYGHAHSVDTHTQYTAWLCIQYTDGHAGIRITKITNNCMHVLSMTLLISNVQISGCKFNQNFLMHF